MKRVMLLLLALVCLSACGPISQDVYIDDPTTTAGRTIDVSTTTDVLSTEDTTATEDTTEDTTATETTGNVTTSSSTTVVGKFTTIPHDRTTTVKATTGKTTKKTTKTTNKTTKSTKTTTATNPISAEKRWYLSLVTSENQWIATCQLSNGAIAMTPTYNGTVKINPYFADIAALSLLNQADIYADHVRRYMDWHFDHLNTASEDPNGVDGTIFDWQATMKDGKMMSEEWLTAVPTYDSTDSYAATFLMVVHKYAEQTGDTAYVVKNAAQIKRVVNALFSTMHNGLTVGKPNSPVKMLMDNCEVYGGLQAATRLYRDVLVPAGVVSSSEATRLKNATADVAAHVESDLWAGTYYRNDIMQSGGSYYPFSWNQYYPSAVAQTFPILYGLLDAKSERAQGLYDQFCRRYDWENLKHPDSYVWASNAYTAAMMGDYERVKTFLTAYEGMVTKSRGYPLYNADAAWACMTAYYMSQIS